MATPKVNFQTAGKQYSFDLMDSADLDNDYQKFVSEQQAYVDGKTNVDPVDAMGWGMESWNQGDRDFFPCYFKISEADIQTISRVQYTIKEQGVDKNVSMDERFSEFATLAKKACDTTIDPAAKKDIKDQLELRAKELLQALKEGGSVAEQQKSSHTIITLLKIMFTVLPYLDMLNKNKTAENISGSADDRNFDHLYLLHKIIRGEFDAHVKDTQEHIVRREEVLAFTADALSCVSSLVSYGRGLEAQSKFPHREGQAGPPQREAAVHNVYLAAEFLAEHAKELMELGSTLDGVQRPQAGSGVTPQETEALSRLRKINSETLRQLMSNQSVTLKEGEPPYSQGALFQDIDTIYNYFLDILHANQIRVPEVISKPELPKPLAAPVVQPVNIVNVTITVAATQPAPAVTPAIGTPPAPEPLHTPVTEPAVAHAVETPLAPAPVAAAPSVTPAPSAPPAVTPAPVPPPAPAPAPAANPPPPPAPTLEFPANLPVIIAAYKDKLPSGQVNPMTGQTMGGVQLEDAKRIVAYHCADNFELQQILQKIENKPGDDPLSKYVVQNSQASPSDKLCWNFISTMTVEDFLDFVAKSKYTDAEELHNFTPAFEHVCDKQKEQIEKSRAGVVGNLIQIQDRSSRGVVGIANLAQALESTASGIDKALEMQELIEGEVTGLKDRISRNLDAGGKETINGILRDLIARISTVPVFDPLDKEAAKKAVKEQVGFTGQEIRTKLAAQIAAGKIKDEEITAFCGALSEMYGLNAQICVDYGINSYTSKIADDVGKMYGKENGEDLRNSSPAEKLLKALKLIGTDPNLFCKVVDGNITLGVSMGQRQESTNLYDAWKAEREVAKKTAVMCMALALTLKPGQTITLTNITDPRNPIPRSLLRKIRAELEKCNIDRSLIRFEAEGREHATVPLFEKELPRAPWHWIPYFADTPRRQSWMKESESLRLEKFPSLMRELKQDLHDAFEQAKNDNHINPNSDDMQNVLGKSYEDFLEAQGSDWAPESIKAFAFDMQKQYQNVSDADYEGKVIKRFFQRKLDYLASLQDSKLDTYPFTALGEAPVAGLSSLANDPGSHTP